METLKLNSDGKVVIPGLGSGNKRITIKQLSDKISHIPDTNSIEVDIDSKQGLLPPERVTSKNEYPYSITMNQGWENTMMGVPHGCNGFIPDYIDTTNLTTGDKVYIIDPKHDDTSKYVLGDDKKWMYVGNYNDPEIGGVEGNDYSNIASTQGGMWLIRQNPKNGEEPVSFEMSKKSKFSTQKWNAILDNATEDGDMIFGCLSAMYNGSIRYAIWVLKVVDGIVQSQVQENLKTYGLEHLQNAMYEKANDITGAWIWKKSDQESGIYPTWITGRPSTTGIEILNQEVKIYEGDATVTNKVKSNLIVNNLDHPIMVNDLIIDGFDTTISKSNDRIWLPGGGVTGSKMLMYMATKAGWFLSGTNSAGQTTYIHSTLIYPGMGFWYDCRGTTPLTIRFK